MMGRILSLSATAFLFVAMGCQSDVEQVEEESTQAFAPESAGQATEGQDSTTTEL